MAELREDVLRSHIEAFVNTFVSQQRKARWLSLFALGERRWGDISVTDFPSFRRQAKGIDYVEMVRSAALLKHPSLRPHLRQETVIIRLGHSIDSGAVTATLDDALSCDILFEGFVSVIPGQLAIVMDHEDQVTICIAD